jgi:hypothetical protein
MDFTPSNGLQLENFDCSSGDVDILLARAYDDNEEDDVVILNFEHILSRVEFRMIHSLSEGMAVRIKKITMAGFADDGEYNTKVQDDWLVGDNDFTYVVYDAGETDGIDIYSGDAQYVGEEFYVIPQPSFASVQIEYDVRYGTANWVPQTDMIKSVMTHWEQNKHYTYTLNLRMDKLTHTTGISSIE